MKLSREQVNALANKVYSDLKAAHDKKVKPFVLSKLDEVKIKEELRKYQEVFKLIDSGLINDFSVKGQGYFTDENQLRKKIICKIETEYKSKQSFSVNKNDVINSIILNTIESKDLNELITKLNKEFSK